MALHRTRFILPGACRPTKSVLLSMASASALLAASPVQAQTTATLTNLSHLDPNFSAPYAHGISADGSIVVGDGFMWSQAKGFSDLGLLGGKYDTPGAFYAISADGQVVAGTVFTKTGTGQPVRWTKAGGLVGLGFIGGGGTNLDGGAAGINQDGSVVVGTSTNASNRNEAFRWTSRGMVGLGFLGTNQNTTYSSANGVSGDGSIVVGASTSARSGYEAFRWTQAGGMTALGYLPGDTGGRANAITPDGATIVGSSTLNFKDQAVRWSGGVVTALGYLETSSNKSSFAAAVSADGSVIVGSASSPNAAYQDTEAFRYTQAAGMKSLTGLITSAGVQLGTDHLESVEAISANGQIMAGTISNNDGTKREAYVVRYIDGTAVAPTTPPPPPPTTPTATTATAPTTATAAPAPATTTIAAPASNATTATTAAAPPAPLANVAPPAIAGLTTAASVQSSINRTADQRAGVMSQQHGFTAALLGDNGRIAGGSEGGGFAAVGSLSGGVAGRYSFGNGFEVLGGLSLGNEDYTQLRARNVFTLAAAGRYIRALDERTRIYGEIGGWYSPTGSYRFERSYSNGVGTATGVGFTKGEQTYVFGRLGAAYDVTPADELGAAVEFGQQRFRTRGYTEALLASNPFNAQVSGSEDRLNIVKARLYETHAFNAAFDGTLWGGVAHGFAYRTSLTATVPGFGQLAPDTRGSTWAEFGARLGYHVNELVTVDLFADGISNRRDTRVHVGGGVKAQF